MVRFYCDYCDSFLTHDSPAVRKQHNSGYKHKSNVKAYYLQFEDDGAQDAIEQQIQEFQRGRGMMPPGGPGGFMGGPYMGGPPRPGFMGGPPPYMGGPPRGPPHPGMMHPGGPGMPPYMGGPPRLGMGGPPHGMGGQPPQHGMGGGPPPQQHGGPGGPGMMQQGMPPPRM